MLIIHIHLSNTKLKHNKNRNKQTNKTTSTNKDNKHNIPTTKTTQIATSIDIKRHNQTTYKQLEYTNKAEYP